MRALLLAAVALASCASADVTEPGAPTLNGEWVEATRALRPPTITFADNGASGFAGCNRWFGQAIRNGESLNFDGIGATRMACEAPMMRIEQNFLAALERTRSYRFVSDDTIALLDENGAELARFLRQR